MHLKKKVSNSSEVDKNDFAQNDLFQHHDCGTVAESVKESAVQFNGHEFSHTESISLYVLSRLLTCHCPWQVGARGSCEVYWASYCKHARPSSRICLLSIPSNTTEKLPVTNLSSQHPLKYH